MDTRKKQLEVLIAHYRLRLAEGMDSTLAGIFVREIAKAEAELAALNLDTELVRRKQQD